METPTATNELVRITCLLLANIPFKFLFPTEKFIAVSLFLSFVGMRNPENMQQVAWKRQQDCGSYPLVNPFSVPYYLHLAWCGRKGQKERRMRSRQVGESQEGERNWKGTWVESRKFFRLSEWKALRPFRGERNWESTGWEMLWISQEHKGCGDAFWETVLTQFHRMVWYSLLPVQHVIIQITHD